MPEKRDLLDDIIDIQSDWQAVRNPFGNVMDALAADPEKAEGEFWNPSAYKERPRANSVFCLRGASKRDEVCNACETVCPVHAIDAHEGKVRISDACRKCGLCSTACPTGVFVFQRIAPQSLYDAIARIAGAYEQCYVTCTRALGHVPAPNEVVLPCIGAISRELWCALITEYGNVSVYLPLGICDRCRNVTGEETYATEIAVAEEWTGEGVGLEVSEKDLSHEYTRAYKRSQFVSGVAQAGATIATRGVPVLAGAKAVSERIRNHTKQIHDLTRTLEASVGAKTTQNRRRVLSAKRKLLMGALQRAPEIAASITLAVPVCDHARCTMCGECIRACPLHACELDHAGRFRLEEAYCVNCGACVQACDETALTMQSIDAASLVLPDPQAVRVAEKRARVATTKKKISNTVRRTLDALERQNDEG